jgi:hypothetical protein
MPHKLSLKARRFRGIAPLIVVLAGFVLASALAQLGGTGQKSEKSDVVLASPSLSATPVAQKLPVRPGGINATHSSVDPCPSSKLRAHIGSTSCNAASQRLFR